VRLRAAAAEAIANTVADKGSTQLPSQTHQLAQSCGVRCKSGTRAEHATDVSCQLGVGREHRGEYTCDGMFKLLGAGHTRDMLLLNLTLQSASPLHMEEPGLIK
jgi:hypothetical protein